MDQVLKVFLCIIWYLQISQFVTTQGYNGVRRQFQGHPSNFNPGNAARRAQENSPSWIHLYNKLQKQKEQKMKIGVRRTPPSPLRPAPYNHYQSPLRRFRIASRYAALKRLQGRKYVPQQIRHAIPYTKKPILPSKIQIATLQLRRNLPQNRKYSVRNQVSVRRYEFPTAQQALRKNYHASFRQPAALHARQYISPRIQHQLYTQQRNQYGLPQTRYSISSPVKHTSLQQPVTRARVFTNVLPARRVQLSRQALENQNLVRYYQQNLLRSHNVNTIQPSQQRYFQKSQLQSQNHALDKTGTKRGFSSLSPPFYLHLTNGMKTSLKDIANRFGPHQEVRTQILKPLSRNNLERKIHMLQKIKKAIVEKHELERQSELVKKEMLEWGTKQLNAISKSRIPKKANLRQSKKQIIPIQIINLNLQKKNISDQKSYKKTIVPHVELTSTKENTPSKLLTTSTGLRRHHVFHATGQTTEQAHDKQWEYRKVHIYHKVSPVKDDFKVHKVVDENAVKRVTVPYDDHGGINADDIDDDALAGADGDDDDDDDDKDDSLFSDDDDSEDDDDDLPNIFPGRSKAPILNIETPSMNEVPEAAKRQLENSPLPFPLYNIDKDVVTPPTDIREPIIDDFISSNKHRMQNGDLDKKSLLNDQNMLEDFMHGDLTGNTASKEKMSDEEMEALQEDQDASSLMKSQDKSKVEDQPEVYGVDNKKGLSPASKETISASFSHGAVPDPGLMGREGVDSSTVGLPKPPEMSLIHPHRQQDHSTIEHVSHQHEKASQEEENDRSENAVDKQVIDGDSDFHHPVNELDNFQGETKKSSDYEPYENNGQEQGMDEDRARDDNEDHYHSHEPSVSKPFELSLPHTSANVEDTIKKLQDNDAMDSESLVKKFSSQIQEKDRHHATEFDASSPPQHESANEQPQEDTSDLLDPLKAQERAIHFSEAAEIANKIRGAGKDYATTFVKNQYPSTSDIADSLLKSSASQLSLPSKASFASDSFKVDSLSPEDALHALNGKASLNDILAKNADSTLSSGPPDAVVNAIQTPAAEPKEEPAKKETEPVVQKAPEQKNSTTANIAISDIENATVAKEVVSILESLGQVKNSLTQADNKTSENQTKPTVEVTNVKPNVSVDTLSESESRAKVANSTKTSESTGSSLPSSIASLIAGPLSGDSEERETKEAVRDLNIAIGILEKKLALMDEAKKSGNKKAIYIVDQTLRGVVKSNVTIPSKVIHEESSLDKNMTKSTNKTERGITKSIISYSIKHSNANRDELSHLRHHRHHHHHHRRRHHRRHHKRLHQNKNMNNKERRRKDKNFLHQLNKTISSEQHVNNTNLHTFRKKHHRRHTFRPTFKTTVPWD